MMRLQVRRQHAKPVVLNNPSADCHPITPLPHTIPSRYQRPQHAIPATTLQPYKLPPGVLLPQFNSAVECPASLYGSNGDRSPAVLPKGSFHMFLLLAPFSAPSVKILIYTRGALYWRRKKVLKKNKKRTGEMGGCVGGVGGGGGGGVKGRPRCAVQFANYLSM